MLKLKNQIYWIIPATVYVVASFFSVINIDGVRDYLAAYDIVVNGNHTLVGPQMAYSFHFGSYWYYLLTIPLFISKSWLSLSVFVAFLTVLKFYYAYKLGELLLGTKFAMLLCASLMLASFTLIQQITFTHTNLIEFAVLFIMYYCFTFNQEKSIAWMLLGFYSGIAIHIHPTTAIVSYWIFIKLYHSKTWLKNSLSLLFGLLIAFTPIIIHEFITGFENIKGAISYFSYNTDSRDFFGALKLVTGVVFITAYDIYLMLFPVAFAKLLFSIHALLLVTSLIIGLASINSLNVNSRQLFVKIALFFIYSIVFIFFLRNRTPWYMTYSLSLCFSLLISISLYAISIKYTLTKFPQYFYSLVLILFIALFASMISKLNTNKILPVGLAWHDIRSLSTDITKFPGYEIPAYLAKQHAEIICDKTPVSIHGPYARLLRSHSGVELLSKCPDSLLYYGRNNTANEILGMPEYFSKHIVQEPINQIGGTLFYQIQSVNPLQQPLQEDFLSEYDKTYDHIKNWKEKVHTIQLYKGNNLSISNVLAGFSFMKVIKVSVNGVEILPVSQTNHSTLYLCQNCTAETTKWQVSYSESIDGRTDIVSF